MTESGLPHALTQYHQGEVASFHMPGHKQQPPSPEAVAALGADIWRQDVSEMGGFDYLHAPSGSIAQAQERAADTFGAGRTFFLVGGSTIGNLAAFVAHASDGSDVAVMRGSHRSVYAGIVLSGAHPHYLAMDYDALHDGWFTPALPDPTSLPSRLAIVHVTRPNYYGMAIDLAPYRELADRTGAILIVDEAHGSHFGFHPAFPTSALQAGADLVIQSTHKTLRALTQASMLHTRVGFDPSLIERALPMLQSSSPSVLLSVSLDLARAELDSHREALFSKLVELVDYARSAVATIEGLTLLQTDVPFDPAKLVIDVSRNGWSGFAASQWLRETKKLWIELADFKRIVLSLTFGDSRQSVDLLLDALRELAQTTPPPNTHDRLSSLPIPTQALNPRTALARPTEVASVDDAQDRICAENIIPYPPGIPLVVPGEVLSANVLRALSDFRHARAKIVGPSDQSGATLRVVC